MDMQAISIDWATALPVIIATAGPTILGFVQQFSTKIEKANWMVKLALSAVISALTATVTSYIASGDAMLAGAGGVIVGAIGAMNIAFRKGTRGNLEVIVTNKTDAPTA
jgi:O-antigen/teichoic acid export membrane protein